MTLSGGYRREIDGLRAMAILAVILHHLFPGRFVHAYLGVDIFFVISGYVVSRSIAQRRDGVIWSFLSKFYWRRWLRLWPALAAMVVVVGLLFGLVGSPIDDLYVLVYRTGLSALLGLSNLYLYRQGSTYFGFEDDFNPFLHTWSLGVETQFYLFWPVLMACCGFGLRLPSAVASRRLFLAAGLVTVASLAAYLMAAQQASFFLAPFRLWELSLGCLVFLIEASKSVWLHRLRLSRGGGPLVTLAVVLMLLFWIPSSQASLITVAVVLCTAVLLLQLRAERGIGRLFAHPVPVGIGMISYSLYLWHWPLIVLARYTIGLGSRALLLLMVVASVATWISWRLENRFRSGKSRLAAVVFIPIALSSLLLSGAILWLLQGPARGALFLGRRTADLAFASSNKRIPGTTISTAMCFLDPDRPVPALSYFSWLCSAGANKGKPMIYFEGDSHAHALLILGWQLLKTQDYGVSFATRGGCPFPFFTLPDHPDYRGERYRLCAPHSRSRHQELSQVLRPGDVVVSESAVANYLAHLTPREKKEALADYAGAVLRLNQLVRARGAHLVLIGPTPSFPQPRIRIPLSLCRPEWFRPLWAVPSQCWPLRTSRDQQLALNRPILALQQRLAASTGSITVFDPMDSLCPAGRTFCASVEDGQLLYSDGSHLTNAGAQRLQKEFLALIRRLAVTHDPDAVEGLSP